ncbi:MAG: hypothetical protein HYT64_02525 [Candidatus Yanofskybacteria bacterium]|nr:hypothetical protein [Candidatus Yanofskybacteria bacterium]
MKKEMAVETSNLENQDGTPESVFEGLHIGNKFLKIYVEDVLKLKPEQKQSIERHITNTCLSGECQDRIDMLVKKMHDNDPKMVQLPENDR